MGTEGRRCCTKCKRFFYPKGFNTHFNACKGRDGKGMRVCPKCGKPYYPKGYYSHVRVCKGKAADPIQDLVVAYNDVKEEKSDGPFIVADSCFETVIFADDIAKVNQIVGEMLARDADVNDLIVYKIAEEYTIKRTTTFNLIKKA